MFKKTQTYAGRMSPKNFNETSIYSMRNMETSYASRSNSRSQTSRQQNISELMKQKCQQLITNEKANNGAILSKLKNIHHKNF